MSAVCASARSAICASARSAVGGAGAAASVLGSAAASARWRRGPGCSGGLPPDAGLQAAAGDGVRPLGGSAVRCGAAAFATSASSAAASAGGQLTRRSRPRTRPSAAACAAAGTAGADVGASASGDSALDCHRASNGTPGPALPHPAHAAAVTGTAAAAPLLAAGPLVQAQLQQTDGVRSGAASDYARQPHAEPAAPLASPRESGEAIAVPAASTAQAYEAAIEQGCDVPLETPPAKEVSAAPLAGAAMQLDDAAAAGPTTAQDARPQLPAEHAVGAPEGHGDISPDTLAAAGHGSAGDVGIAPGSPAVFSTSAVHPPLSLAASGAVEAPDAAVRAAWDGSAMDRTEATEAVAVETLPAGARGSDRAPLLLVKPQQGDVTDPFAQHAEAPAQLQVAENASATPEPAPAAAVEAPCIVHSENASPFGAQDAAGRPHAMQLAGEQLPEATAGAANPPSASVPAVAGGVCAGAAVAAADEQEQAVALTPPSGDMFLAASAAAAAAAAAALDPLHAVRALVAWGRPSTSQSAAIQLSPGQVPAVSPALPAQVRPAEAHPAEAQCHAWEESSGFAAATWIADAAAAAPVGTCQGRSAVSGSPGSLAAAGTASEVSSAEAADAGLVSADARLPEASGIDADGAAGPPSPTDAAAAAAIATHSAASLPAAEHSLAAALLPAPAPATAAPFSAAAAAVVDGFKPLTRIVASNDVPRAMAERAAREAEAAGAAVVAAHGPAGPARKAFKPPRRGPLLPPPGPLAQAGCGAGAFAGVGCSATAEAGDVNESTSHPARGQDATVPGGSGEGVFADTARRALTALQRGDVTAAHLAAARKYRRLCNVLSAVAAAGSGGRAAPPSASSGTAAAAAAQPPRATAGPAARKPLSLPATPIQPPRPGPVTASDVLLSASAGAGGIPATGFKRPRESAAAAASAGAGEHATGGADVTLAHVAVDAAGAEAAAGHVEVWAVARSVRRRTEPRGIAPNAAVMAAAAAAKAAGRGSSDSAPMHGAGGAAATDDDAAPSAFRKWVAWSRACAEQQAESAAKSFAADAGAAASAAQQRGAPGGHFPAAGGCFDDLPAGAAAEEGAGVADSLPSGLE
jgi:hypothetical protein